MSMQQRKAGLNYQQIEKIFESLPAYPNDAAGNPTPVPAWVLDEIEYSVLEHPEDWKQFGGRNKAAQFKEITGYDINNPNAYESNYSPSIVTGIRPAGGTMDTAYEGFLKWGPFEKNKSFTLKVTNNWINKMKSYGWTFNGGIVTTSVTEPQPFEFFPTAAAEPELIMKQTPSNQVNTIINDIQRGVISIPDWFKNNIEWVQAGQITEESFITSFNHLTEREITIPDDTINNNMVIQRVNDFAIIDGRAKGSITFTATDSFNPYFYGKDIINIVQLKTPNGANILPFIKQNRLNFTATERDETIFYDEFVKENTRVTVESFVWEWMDKPAGAFSKPFNVNISVGKNGIPALPQPITSGIMGAGVVGAIGILILLGFVADSRGKK